MEQRAQSAVQRYRRSLGEGLAFIGIGLVTAAVGEWQYSVAIRGDWGNLIGSVGFNALFMVLVLAGWRALRQVSGDRWWWVVVFTCVCGTLGLMVEWFLIGNSPWGNPDAVQWGMFSFWACMGLVPAALMDGRERGRMVQWVVIGLGAGYVTLMGVGQMLPGPGLRDEPPLRFVFNILSVILGYTVMAVVCAVGLVVKKAITGRRVEEMK